MCMCVCVRVRGVVVLDSLTNRSHHISALFVGSASGKMWSQANKCGCQKYLYNPHNTQKKKQKIRKSVVCVKVFFFSSPAHLGVFWFYAAITECFQFPIFSSNCYNKNSKLKDTYRQILPRGLIVLMRVRRIFKINCKVGPIRKPKVRNFSYLVCMTIFKQF